ncbi:MAG: acyl-CoA dehydrogenase family protein [Acidimicrobiales bacterium]|jgi:alkylation response protein AidB-like acyl-CoA dehydrogenase
MADTISVKDFERAAVAFLEANAERRVVVEQAWGEGSDDVSLLPERTREEEAAELEAAQTWARTRFDAGFGWITGPTEYGGQGLTRDHARAYDAVESGFEIPPMSVFGIGLGMVAPTILAHATDEVKGRYLRALWRGDIVGCQLFSEPGAGSDLAGLQTRAVRDGDEWLVTGQKVWTSGAHLSDIGEIICRTDPDLPKHKGLTGFVVDMRAPGVDIRPLRQMTGGASFNEVFFTDVRVPDSHRLGDVNGGWGVALTTLMNERAAIGGGSMSGGGGNMGTNRLIELVRHQGKAADPLVRQQLAEIIIHGRVASYTNLRAMARVAAGQAPGPEMSLAKMSLTANMRRMTDLVSSVLGPKLVADGGEWGTYAWSQAILGLPGMRIAGGTDEVLRNIVGERVLGLPKEPAVK